MHLTPDEQLVWEQTPGSFYQKHKALMIHRSEDGDLNAEMPTDKTLQSIQSMQDALTTFKCFAEATPCQDEKGNENFRKEVMYWLEQTLQCELHRARESLGLEPVGQDWFGPASLTDAAKQVGLWNDRGEVFEKRYVKTGIVLAYQPNPKKPRQWVFRKSDLENLRKNVQEGKLPQIGKPKTSGK